MRGEVTKENKCISKSTCRVWFLGEKKRTYDLFNKVLVYKKMPKEWRKFFGIPMFIGNGDIQ